MMKPYRVAAIALVLGGCAGFQKSCASFNAENFATDWIVVQNDYTMAPKNCWRLPETSISIDQVGIYWLDPHKSHLVHIDGWYNRVQVNRGDWASAAATLGIDLQKCNDGIYR